MAIKKILKLSNPCRLHFINVYLHEDESVTYKVIDVRKFTSLDKFKEEYKKVFKKDARFHE